MLLCTLEFSKHLRASVSNPSSFSLCSVSVFTEETKGGAWTLKAELCLVSEEMVAREPDWGPYWGSLPAWGPGPLYLPCPVPCPQAVSCPSFTFWIRVLGDSSDKKSNQMNYGISKEHLHLFFTLLGKQTKGHSPECCLPWWKAASWGIR